MPPYAELLRELFGRAQAGIKLGLDAPAALLQALGAPEQALRNVVVVAGTNGKGSTAALMAAALGHAGHRVGLFTSPHLLRFAERIRIDGTPLDDSQIAALFERVRAVEARCPRPPTFFECTTAMAVLAFAEAEVDVTVLEVGLGGRLDATNVVPHRLAVLTPIDLDHTDLLGTTVAAIAAEKAAIISAGGAVVSAAQQPAAQAVISEVARERAARLVWAAPAKRHNGALALDAYGGLRLPEWPAVPFLEHNLAVAAQACSVFNELGVACPPAAFAAAAAHFVWPGRYQWLTDQVLVDGAHNPAAVRALCTALTDDARAAGRPLHLVFTALSNKDAPAMLKLLSARARSLHLTPVESRRSRNLEELRALAPHAAVHAHATAALERAIELARADGGAVLVTGSLFLVAEVTALLTGAPRDPPVDG